MARDYSSRRKPVKSSKRAKRRPAARAQNQGLPGWVQLFVGLTIGLLVAAAVFIKYKPLETNLAGDGPARGSEAAEQAQDENGLPPEEETRFAFYDMLPNYELVIQYEDEDQPATKKPSKEEKPKPKTKTPETPKEVAEPGRYIIQAGSFKSFDDADKRKAKLALLLSLIHI